MAESRGPLRPGAGSSPPRSRRAPDPILRAFGWLGIFGIGAAVGAILGALDVSGWIIGVIVSGATVLLGFLLRRALAA